MTTSGVVRNWDIAEGWGVLDSPATPGGCWAHYSSLVGFGHLKQGQEATLDYEPAQQDGYDFRATRVQPTGEEIHWPTIVVPGPSEAYRSKLSITYDSPSESDRS